jgi:hypothetical protein
VGHATVAAGFCIQDQYKLVDVCFGRNSSLIDRVDYDKLPGDKNGVGESCRIVAIRVSKCKFKNVKIRNVKM